MEFSAERRALLERASADPASITPAEKNDILLLPPADVENQLHQSNFNLNSRAELVAKGLRDDGAELTFDEARWFRNLGEENPWRKAGIDAWFEGFHRRFRTPIDDRMLLRDAQEVVLTPDEQRARSNAKQRADRLREEKVRFKEEQRAKLRELHGQRRAKWVQSMLDAALPRWGFVVLRTAYPDDESDADNCCSDAAWQRLPDYFKGTCKFVLNMWKGGWDLVPTHENVWVSDREALEGGDTATLRARMRAMREAGEIPEGVRGDVFLVADKDMFCNEFFANGIPYSERNKRETIRLRAVDPDHDPSAQPVPTEGPYTGFDGEITLPLPKVFEWLYYTFFAESESWPLRYWQTITLGKEDKGKQREGTELKGPTWWNRPVMPYPRYEF
jgi:hypothetical protein